MPFYFQKNKALRKGRFGMFNQSDVSSTDGEFCGLGGSNTGNVCDLRDEVKEGRGELQETFFFFFLPPSSFHVPYDVRPLEQRYVVSGICAFTQRISDVLVHWHIKAGSRSMRGCCWALEWRKPWDESEGAVCFCVQSQFVFKVFQARWKWTLWM